MKEVGTPRLVERVARLEERSQLVDQIAWLRWIPVLVICLLALGAMVIGGRVVIVPLLSSVALAYLLSPLAAWFRRRGWSHPASALLTTITASLIAALLLIFLLPSVWAQLLLSYDRAQTLLSDEARVEEALGGLRQVSPPVYAYLSRALSSLRDPARQAELRETAEGWLQSGLFGLVDFTASIIDLLLIPFFVFYLLSDYRLARGSIEELIPPRYRATASGLLLEINRALSSYVRSQMLIGLIMGLLYALGFAALRVPLGLTIGLLAGLLNFIPYFGTLVGMALALSFVALDGGGFWRLGGVLGVFALVQTIEGYYLTPRLLGSRLNLHPMLVLLSLMIGGNLFGLLGIILAVPTLATAKVILALLADLYRRSAFYRRPSAALLTTEGSPVELPSPIASTSSPFVETPERERRIIITTGELRARARTPPTPPRDEP